MPNQLIALVTQLTAKTASFVSIRHSPGFGIATTVMGRNSGDARSRGVWLKQLPDNLLTHANALHLAAAVQRSEYVTLSYAGRGGPRVGCHLHPCRHRN